MRKIVFIFATITSGLLFTRCASTDTAKSDAVNQAEIYQSYSVVYDAGDKELSATATFRFGGPTGTTLSLAKPSIVSFNGEAMLVENSVFTGTYYKIEKQTNFVNTCTFVFVDTQNMRYINSAPLMAAEFREYPSNTDKKTGFTVNWDDPLKPGETVTLNIEDGKNNTASVSINTQGATKLTFEPDDLKLIEPGPCKIGLVRVSALVLKEATHLHGDLNVKYISEKRWVNLTGALSLQKKSGKTRKFSGRV